MSANGFEGIKRTSTFSNKGGDVMVKCESVTDGYTKYVQFIHSNNIGDESWIKNAFFDAGGGQSFPVTWSCLILNYWLQPSLLCVGSIVVQMTN